MPPRIGAFFDVDKTILAENSGALYFRALWDRGEVDWQTLAVNLGSYLRYKLNLLNLERWTESILLHFRGQSVRELEAQATEWFAEYVRPAIYPEARELIAKHRAEGHVVALVSGATYVARAFSGDPNYMADLIAGGIRHKGFALIDAFSPCVTYNKLNTYPWFKKRVYKLDDEAGYETGNVRAALEKSFEWGDRIPLGLFYRDQQPTYEDSEPAFKRGPLVHQPLGVDPALFQSLLDELM